MESNSTKSNKKSQNMERFVPYLDKVVNEDLSKMKKTEFPESKSKKIDRKKIGKRNKLMGADFERRTRKDLEEKGWIVDKWSNNVELTTPEDGLTHAFLKGKLIPCKRKWIPGRPMVIGTGFPDFIAFKIQNKHIFPIEVRKHFNKYDIIGVESKINGYLDPTERKKCDWLLKNNIFSKILIASKEKIRNHIVVKYKEYENNI